MRQKQALPISRADRGNRNIATIVACMLVPLAIPTLVWIALVAGLPSMLGIGVLYFAASSMWVWYHIFQLHRPAKYCVNQSAIEPRAANEGVNRGTESPTAERDRALTARLAQNCEDLLAGHRP